VLPPLVILLSFQSPTLNNSSCLNGTLKVNLCLYFQARIAFLQGERKGQENLKNDLVTFPQDFFSSSLTPTFNKLERLPVEVFYVSRVEATSNDETLFGVKTLTLFVSQTIFYAA